MRALKRLEAEYAANRLKLFERYYREWLRNRQQPGLIVDTKYWHQLERISAEVSLWPEYKKAW